ncbi:MAG: hypothetical protein DWQ07_14100 [Chloroflexi bacterium]|nr:MAG: hypothetical protein DWQ07_14100 [Chloroflexota bacterium]
MLSHSQSEQYTQQDARRELARRGFAKQNLVPFIEYLAPWYTVKPVHKLIAEKLEQVELYIRTWGKEGVGRLIIEVQPRIGKTEEVSKFFPAWMLGRMPDISIVLASHTLPLASDNSKDVRDYVSSQEYQNIFGDRAITDEPVHIDPEGRSVKAWRLGGKHRGRVTAAGVGTALPGRGGDLIILDDIIKSRDDANNKDYRDSLERWYGTSVSSRKEGGRAAIIIVIYRYHLDDLTGRMLKKMVNNPLADQWEVLSLPSVALEKEQYAKNEEDQRKKMRQGLFVNLKDPLGREPGEVLWPEKFSPKDLEREKANITQVEWASLWQQQPIPVEGKFFKPSWEYVDFAPDSLLWFRYWDLAASIKKDSDRTASAAVAMDFKGNLYIKDMIAWTATWPESQERIAALSKEEPANVIYGVEQVAFQLAAFQDLMADKRMVTRAILPIIPEGNKETRAYPLQTRQELGQVFLVRGPWTIEFEDAAVVFPHGEHDDEIDTITGGMQMIREWVELEGVEEGVLVHDEPVNISPL